MYTNKNYYLSCGKILLMSVPMETAPLNEYLSTNGYASAGYEEALELTCVRGLVSTTITHTPLQRQASHLRNNNTAVISSRITDSKITVQCFVKNLLLLKQMLNVPEATVLTSQIELNLPIKAGDAWVLTTPASSFTCAAPLDTFSLDKGILRCLKDFGTSGTLAVALAGTSHLALSDNNLNSICAVNIVAEDIVSNTTRQIIIPYATVAFDGIDYDFTDKKEAIVNAIIYPHFKHVDLPLMSFA